MMTTTSLQSISKRKRMASDSSSIKDKGCFYYSTRVVESFVVRRHNIVDIVVRSITAGCARVCTSAFGPFYAFSTWIS